MAKNPFGFRASILLLGLGGQAAFAASITVNTATDDFGSVPGNCSLREAIQSANDNVDFGGCDSTGVYGAAITDVITLPSLGAGGAFLLSRVGTDDTNAAGDLDIDGNTRIDGVSATNSLIRGDTGDPDIDRHRLVHVIGGTVVLNDLTLRDGLEDNQAAGGGLRTEPGTATVLNRVVVADNIADGNAGGILNRGTMTINASTVAGNEARNATSGGGGLFNSPQATLIINDSRIIDNTARIEDGTFPGGGGIYSDSDASLILDNSVVDGNVATGLQIGFDERIFGGGIYAEGTVEVRQSSVTNNLAEGRSTFGGGIALRELDQSLIDRAVVSGNVAFVPNAASGTALGGGIYASRDALGSRIEIRDSVISFNTAETSQTALGGGVEGEFRIVRSTLAHNEVRGAVDTSSGGGLHCSASDCDVVNSTIINNLSDGDGGGASYFSVDSTSLRFRSSTIAGNSAGRSGGGVIADTGIIDLANSVIAGNSAAVSGPDCSGRPRLQSNNLIQTGAGCDLTFSDSSDLIDVVAGLAPAANNGGAVAGSNLGLQSGFLTRAPLPGSALIDAAPAQCFDVNGTTTLTTDQTGRSRSLDGPDPDSTANCDIGAIEFSPTIFADGFEDAL